MMDDFDQFEAVFGFKSDVAYNQQTIDDIIRHRRKLDNALFVDRLLKALGIDKREYDVCGLLRFSGLSLIFDWYSKHLSSTHRVQPSI